MTESGALYNLVINNQKLETLEAQIKKFNPFKILKIENHEIRHSNVLAWMLDPKENHNLGDKIFKKIVSHVMINNEEIAPSNLSINDFQLGSFSDLLIFREKNDIDILAVSKANRFVLLIENKIKSRESRHQLKKYLDLVQNEYKDFSILPVLLTLEGIGAENDDRFCSLDYSNVFEIVKFTADLYKEYFPNEVFDFIQFYLKSLKGILEMDENTKKLCKEIYQQHKDALDLIFQVVNISETAFLNAVEEFEKQHPKIQTTAKNNTMFWFTLPEFKNMKRMSHQWNGGYPVAVWFSDYYKKLKIIFEIGPFDNPEKRLELMKRLEENGFRIHERSKRPESTYTRIFTKYLNVNDWSDADHLVSLMNHLYEKDAKEKIERATKAINSFEW